MHTPLLGYSFHAHALAHHGLFRADRSYHLQREEDEPKVTFAWWNAPGLLLLHMPLLIGLGSLGGRAAWGGAGVVSYYALYEYLHWCMRATKPSDGKHASIQIFSASYLHHRALEISMWFYRWRIGCWARWCCFTEDLTAELVTSVTPSSPAIARPQGFAWGENERGGLVAIRPAHWSDHLCAGGPEHSAWQHVCAAPFERIFH
jgi:hypothetical protein